MLSLLCKTVPSFFGDMGSVSSCVYRVFQLRASSYQSCTLGLAALQVTLPDSLRGHKLRQVVHCTTRSNHTVSFIKKLKNQDKKYLTVAILLRLFQRITKNCKVHDYVPVLAFSGIE